MPGPLQLSNDVEFEGSALFKNFRLENSTSLPGDTLSGRIDYKSNTDDEHLRFADGSSWIEVPRIDIDETVTGVWNFNPGTGSVPFTVPSGRQGVVTNLNADMVDGYHANQSLVASTAAVRNSDGTLHVATPTGDTHAANKGYVDAAFESKDWKESVVAASTINVDTSSMPATLDGETLSNGDRTLLKNQTDQKLNGIWQFNGVGSAATRTVDADEDAEVTAGFTVYVSRGSDHAGALFTITTPDPIVVGTTNIEFTQTGGSDTFGEGNGIVLVDSKFHFIKASNYAIGDIPYASSTTQMAFLDAGDSHRFLKGNGTGSAPSFGAVELGTADVTGTLPTSKGGTGSSAGFSSGAVIFADGSGNLDDDSANLYWNNTDKRLGIGINTPWAGLHVDSDQLSIFSIGGGIGSLSPVTSPTGLVNLVVGDDSTISGGVLRVVNAGNRGTKGHASGSALADFSFSNATAFHVNKDGQVGIGTSTIPSGPDLFIQDGASGATLAYGSETKLAIDALSGGVISISTRNGYASGLEFSDNLSINGAGFKYYSTSGSNKRFIWYSGSNQAYLNETGFGLGAGAFNPAYLLDVLRTDNGDISRLGKTGSTIQLGVDDNGVFSELDGAGSLRHYNDTSKSKFLGYDSSGNATISHQGTLKFGDLDNSNFVGFKAPSTVAGSVTWTLPSTDALYPSSALISDGTGELFWKEILTQDSAIQSSMRLTGAFSRLDGASDYYTSNDSSEWNMFTSSNGDRPFTLSAFAKIDTLEYGGIITKSAAGGAGNLEYTLMVNTGGTLVFGVYDSSGNIAYVESDSDLSNYVGQWVMFSAVCNPVSAVGSRHNDLSIYVNGELIPQTQNIAGAYSGMFSSGASLEVGRYEGATYFNGSISSAFVFNTALSQSGVNSLLKDGQPQQIHRWGGAAGSIIDQSSWSSHGWNLNSSPTVSGGGDHDGQTDVINVQGDSGAGIYTSGMPVGQTAEVEVKVKVISGSVRFSDNSSSRTFFTCNTSNAGSWTVFRGVQFIESGTLTAYAAEAGSEWYIDDIKVTKSGCIAWWSQGSLQRGAWYDNSSNGKNLSNGGSPSATSNFTHLRVDQPVAGSTVDLISGYNDGNKVFGVNGIGEAEINLRSSGSKIGLHINQTVGSSSDILLKLSATSSEDTSRAISFEADEANEKFIVWGDGTLSIGTDTPVGEATLIHALRPAGQAIATIGSGDGSGALLVLDGNANGDGIGGNYAYIGHSSTGVLEMASTTSTELTVSGGNALKVNSDKTLSVGWFSGTHPLDVYSGSDQELIHATWSSTGSDGCKVTLFHDSSSPANDDELGAIQFKGRDSSGGSRLGASIAAIVRDVGSSYNDSDLVLSAFKNDAAVDVLYVTHDSRVGVMTDAPSTIFQVNNSLSAETVPVMISATSTGDAAIRYNISGVSNWTSGVDNSDDDKFKISPGSALSTAPVITLLSSGTLGVNTATPSSSYTLDVNGHVVASTFYSRIANTSGELMDTIAYQFTEGRGWGYNSNVDRVFYNGANGKVPWYCDLTSSVFADINVTIKRGDGSDVVLNVDQNATGDSIVSIQRQATGNSSKLEFVDGGNVDWAIGTFGSTTFRINENGDTTRFVVLDGGNTGIGTATPGEKLHVAGGVRIDALTADLVVFTDANKSLTSTGVVGTSQGGTGTSTTFTQGSVVFSGAGGVFSQDNGNFFWDNANNRLGLLTDTPETPIHVKHDASGDNLLGILENANTDGGGSLMINRSGDARAASIQIANDRTAEWHIGVLRWGGSPTSGFAVSSGSDLYTHAAEFSIYGNKVGIGVSRPTRRFEVIGSTSEAEAVNNIESSIYIENKDSSDNATSVIAFGHHDSGGNGHVPCGIASRRTNGGTTRTADLEFYCADADNFDGNDLRMRLDGSGSVHIGGDVRCNDLLAWSYPGNSFLKLNDSQTLDSIMVTLASIGAVNFIIDSNNNSTTSKFRWMRDSTDIDAATSLMELHESGNLSLGSSTDSERLAITGDSNTTTSISLKNTSNSNFWRMHAHYADQSLRLRADGFTVDLFSVFDTGQVTIGETPTTSDTLTVSALSSVSAASSIMVKGNSGYNAILRLHSAAGAESRDLWSVQARASTTRRFAITEDSTDRFVIEEGGNAGIGTETPGAKLHVVGGDGVSDTIFKANDRITISGDGVLRWGIGADQGFLSWSTGLAVVGALSTNDLGFWTAGNQKGVLKNNGAWGLGSGTSPDWRLVVYGSTTFASTGTTQVRAAANGSGIGLQVYCQDRTSGENGVSAFEVIDRAGNTAIKTTVGGDTVIGGWANFDGDGLGLGLSPASGVRLHVDGEARFDSLSASSVVFTDANKSLTTSGTIGLINGGTGHSTVTEGDLLVGDAGGAGYVRRSLGDDKKILQSNGTTAWWSTPSADDLDDGTTNLFFTNARARSAISVSGGLLTYNATTGVIGLSNTAAQAVAFNIGNGTDKDIVVTHNLGTKDLIVSVVKNASPYNVVLANWEATTTDTITIGTFATAPGTNAYRVVIIGA